MSQIAIEPHSNLKDWDAATSSGTVDLARPVPTRAALEILNDPHWARKVLRALEQSERGEGIPLEQYLEDAE